jgi:hypothetical protein
MPDRLAFIVPPRRKGTYLAVQRDTEIVVLARLVIPPGDFNDLISGTVQCTRHSSGGCISNECPCYANGYRDGYEDGRQAEQEEPTGGPIRNEGWD